jgi:Fe-S cluster assembly ATP-binding protein
VRLVEGDSRKGRATLQAGGTVAGADAADACGDRAERLLQVDRVRLARSGRCVLRGVDLVVHARDVHVLLGPNGSGKSTLAKVVMGCPGYEPDAGVVRFAGRDMAGSSITDRARLGITLGWQEPARFEGLTVRDYVGLSPMATDDDVTRSLQDVALDPATYLDRPVDRTMSGGERKRIELAAVVAMHPRLAILDEPDSGIDVLTLGDVASLIRTMAQSGATLVVITHRDEMLATADAASLMCDGVVVHTGRPDEVRSRYAEHAHHGSRDDLRTGRFTPFSIGEARPG